MPRSTEGSAPIADRDNRPTLLVLTQVYVPDPASVGQHMADVAVEMVRRGWRVVVLTADRGYDDTSKRYPQSALLDGVEVVRLPLASLGKASLTRRALGGLLFICQAVTRALGLGRIARILVSTSPPMASAGALVVSLVKRAPVTYWVMDVNPDQSVVLGLLQPKAAAVRALDALNRAILRRAVAVVVLDRYMAARVNAKRDVARKLVVLPPWPHEDHLRPIPHRDNPFRVAHGLEDKVVVMYSGNHTPSNPLDTVLAAAARLRRDPRFVFMFIGGGIGKKQVEGAGLPNVRSLPYQPLDQLSYSLSAADIHVVTLGDQMVGIIHPCKVYGAMTVARPVLLVGPAESHVADLLREYQMGWQVAHGDVEGLVRRIEGAAEDRCRGLAELGRRGRAAVIATLSKRIVCSRFCDVLERGQEKPLPASEMAKAAP